ncbi:MAG: cytochrome b/b6 domain-containing protein [Methylococcales bacterium]|nr:cytochrome b/b6 domain-containing protein [Methylococcales bacterium]
MSAEQQDIKVWDILVRIFHWSLVIAFSTAYLTSEEDNIYHIYAGYTVLGLIVFRVFWGFFGSKYARFRSFMTSPFAMFDYVNNLSSKNPKRYIGHNPAGGWMVVVMLITLFFVTFSGLEIYALEKNKGPLSIEVGSITPIASAYAKEDEEQKVIVDTTEEDEEYWEEVHETATNFMLFLIVVHIAGVVVTSKIHNESLAKAMLTGKKRNK